MSPNLLRLAYISEFLLALVSITELWSQVGGPGHLDLIPWYTKLSLTLALALVTVIGTISAVAHQRAWNAKTLTCLIVAVILAGVGGAALVERLLGVARWVGRRRRSDGKQRQAERGDERAADHGDGFSSGSSATACCF